MHRTLRTQPGVTLEIMGLGRRRVGLHEPERWVYNRMAAVYAARPPYPDALVARLSALAGGPPSHVLDVGAGIGHLSLPLAALGHRVSAVEPAIAMLDGLRARAAAHLHNLTAVHATAEALPLPDASVELVVIADALHFLDAHRAGSELGRVLRVGGTLAVVQVELGTSPFMLALQQLMQESAPRRPKRVSGAMTQLAALSGVRLELAETFEPALPVTHDELERIASSISFIGPAMNAARFQAFCTRLRAIPHAPVWQTTIRLWAGLRE